MKTFTFKGKLGSLDEFGVVAWNGTNVQLSDASPELQKAITEQTGVDYYKNQSFQNGRHRAVRELAERHPGKFQNAGKMIAFPGDNNPNSGVWFVGEGFGKSSTGVRYKSEAEAKAAADKINRTQEAAREHDAWKEKQRDYISSGDARRAAQSRR